MRHEHWRPHHRPFPHPPPGLRRKRRFLLGRFARPFGCASLVFVALLVGVGAVLYRQYPDQPLVSFLALAGCVPAGLFLILAAGFSAHAFRELEGPLSNVMAAADAVAQGDLDVQVPEQAPGEFGQLARSFNRMTRELARAEEQRRNLTADVAHELRTPLHIIQGNLEGVLDGVYEPTPEHLEATLEETRRLARLVDDLQTLSLAEAGQLPLHMGPVDAAELLEDALTSFSGQAEAAGVRLEAQVDLAGGKPTLVGDAGRLGQALANLVANALRHTPQGGTVRLEARLQGEKVLISVADTGEGIAEADLPFVFDRFWRGDKARGRSGMPGSGLGLPIARQLVQAHGGRIELQSQVGKGTRFVIVLDTTGIEHYQ
ncbi:MAG: HAMP domain-containing histidine kinase [Anaerolineales bacterium]|nr:HAMP domain-containing histidine kinase [Anaerolineales bacterium]